MTQSFVIDIPVILSRRSLLCRTAQTFGHSLPTVILLQQLFAANSPKTEPTKAEVDYTILSQARWKEIEHAVDRAIKWMVTQQQPSGGFGAGNSSEPGITGLCVLALLARGHLPGIGPYGTNLERGLRFIVESQQPDGLLARSRSRLAGNYNHGIGGLALAELYGLTRTNEEDPVRHTIERAIRFASKRLSQPKAHAEDEGGWRYLTRHAESDSDLSITSWHLMFLRSARNSGFEIDVRLVDDALAYIRRVFDNDIGTFRYEIYTDDPGYNHTRAMAAAGILSLAMAGDHESPLARRAAEYLLRHPFTQYARPISGEQYQCYSAFYCSQAMFQLGGKYWREFYPQFSSVLLEAQTHNGSWRPESGGDLEYGLPYITALTALALSAPFQVLPIFQR